MRFWNHRRPAPQPAVRRKILVSRDERKLDKIDKRLDGPCQRSAGPPPSAASGADPKHGLQSPGRRTDVVSGAKARSHIIEGFDFALPVLRQRGGRRGGGGQHPDEVRVFSKQYVVHPQVATLPALAVWRRRSRARASSSRTIWARRLEQRHGRPKFDQTKLTRAIEKAATPRSST